MDVVICEQDSKTSAGRKLCRCRNFLVFHYLETIMMVVPVRQIKLPWVATVVLTKIQAENGNRKHTGKA
jgi:hypothetical protein